jgi:hypothetical protein
MPSERIDWGSGAPGGCDRILWCCEFAHASYTAVLWVIQGLHLSRALGRLQSPIAWAASHKALPREHV